MKPPLKYVIDASVVVKWFSKFEEDVDRSEELMNSYIEGKCSLMSPSLLLYELSNALRFNPNFKKEDVSKALESLLKLGLELIDFREVFEQAVELAFSRDITMYDAVYVAVSQVYHVPLVTADYELLEKVKELPFAMSLKEMRL